MGTAKRAVTFAGLLVLAGYGGDASARYLSPEPYLQNPRWVAEQARAGYSTPAYAYARNNPVHFRDPTGLEVQNLSPSSVVVKVEEGNCYIVLPPGETYHGKQDAVYTGNGDVYKTAGKPITAGGSVIVNPNGSVTVFPNAGSGFGEGVWNSAGPFSVGDPALTDWGWMSRRDAQSLINNANNRCQCGGR